MHLADVLARRAIPAAAVLAAITRRCPLRCRHCSTNSEPAGEDCPREEFLRFVGGLGGDHRPELVILTGGEPLLRPGLVRTTAQLAREAGTRTMVVSGMFFARSPEIPRPVWKAICALDHFSASLDTFHENEVPRGAVLRAVSRIRDAGVPVSFHIVGSGAGDPYLRDVTDQVREEFADEVPMLVSSLQPAGRAASWAQRTPLPPAPVTPLPCTNAAWPVIGFDGTITACCNQRVVDHRPLPGHLRLGHITTHDWPAVRQACLSTPALRALRLVGPRTLAARSGQPVRGYCDTCRGLSHRPTATAAETVLAGPAAEVLEERIAAMHTRVGAKGYARRFAIPRYADLVELGRLPDRVGQ